jgi:hypothetical protein
MLGRRPYIRLFLLTLVIILAAFAWFVWPSPWAYFDLPARGMAVRFSRVSGRAQKSTKAGWVDMTPAEVSSFKEQVRYDLRSLENVR